MSIPTTAVARYQPALSDVERMALLGFLAGYRGFTRDAYALDLRQFTAWCWQHDHRLFDVRRVDIECFARDLEDRGKARATVARRLCTIVGFYRYAEEEGVIEHSPAVHIRRPRIDYESHVAHLDRNELGGILVAAGLSSPRDHALVSLLALNGLRVSEAIGQHRSPRPRTRTPHPQRAAQGRQASHHATGPACRPRHRPGRRRTARRADLHRHRGAAAGSSRRRADRATIARRAEVGKRVGPHTLRHAFITAALDAGVPLRDVQEAASHADPRTTMRYDRGRQSLDRHATYIVATFVAGASR